MTPGLTHPRRRSNAPARPTASSSRTSPSARCNPAPATAMPSSSPMRARHHLPLRAQPGRSAHPARADAGGGRLRQCAQGGGHRLRPSPARSNRCPRLEDRNKQTTRCSPTPRTASPTPSMKPTRYRTRCPAKQHLRVDRLPPTGPAGRYQASTLSNPIRRPGRLRHKFTDEVAYEATPPANPPPPHRVAAHALPAATIAARRRTIGLLPLGELQPLALPGESYQLAFTPGLLDGSSAPRQASPLLPDADPRCWGGTGGDQRRLRGSRRQRPLVDPLGPVLLQPRPADKSRHRTGASPSALLPAAPLPRPLRPGRLRRFRRQRPADGRNPRRARQPRHGGRQRLPRPAAAPRQRSEPQPDRSRLRHARHGGRHRRDGQAAARAGGRRHAHRLRHRPHASQLDGFFDAGRSAQGKRAADRPRLWDATTRIVYDLDRFQRTGRTTAAVAARLRRHLARETHVSARCRRRA
jgi:hypothetical protein